MKRELPALRHGEPDAYSWLMLTGRTIVSDRRQAGGPAVAGGRPVPSCRAARVYSVVVTALGGELAVP